MEPRSHLNTPAPRDVIPFVRPRASKPRQRVRSPAPPSTTADAPAARVVPLPVALRPVSGWVCDIRRDASERVTRTGRVVRHPACVRWVRLSSTREIVAVVEQRDGAYRWHGPGGWPHRKHAPTLANAGRMANDAARAKGYATGDEVPDADAPLCSSRERDAVAPVDEAPVPNAARWTGRARARLAFDLLHTDDVAILEHVAAVLGGAL